MGIEIVASRASVKTIAHLDCYLFWTRISRAVNSKSPLLLQSKRPQ